MMGTWTRVQKVGTFVGGLATGASVIYYLGERKETSTVLNSWTTNTVPNPCAKWNTNWDHRDPKSLVKPVKENANEAQENAYNEKVEAKKGKAVRHILLIRHGQYFLKGKTDKERFLSDVGRKQAEFTGQRLKALNISWDLMIKSTMTRAQETGDLICKYLPGLKIENCPLIEEGAPIPPEPPIGHWRPEPSQFFEDGSRIEFAFRKYFHRADAKQEKDSYTLMVCHANVIRYFVCRALQFPPEAWLRLSLNHASITWLSIFPNGRVILRSYSDAGHMPPDHVTVHNV